MAQRLLRYGARRARCGISRGQMTRCTPAASYATLGVEIGGARGPGGASGCLTLDRLMEMGLKVSQTMVGRYSSGLEVISGWWTTEHDKEDTGLLFHKSVLKKRRVKMNKHKHRKRMKKMKSRLKKT
ncbi:hypothetical protein AAMO2058_001134100 [Amorphochlora amoebiformis]|eukprot:1261805-Amorphochlora_amoeboformis.AAC.1